ncbi:MAG: sarcosine oxidase subunit gamma [Rhizobium sp.]
MADMTLASRKSVLEGFHGGSSLVRLTPAAPATRVSLRAGTDAVAGLSRALGVKLPVKPKTSASAKGRTAFWLGPDEWLVIDEKSADLMGDCAASGTVHSATDVSHRNMAIIVSGPGAQNTINAGCPLDLSRPAFPVGAVTRTVFGKIEIVLYRVDEDTFRVECWRSFAEYAFGLLSEAAEDAGA